MKNYLKSLPGRIRLWQKFHTLPKGIVESGRVPSETYGKYPPGYLFEGKRVLNIGCGTSVYPAPNVCNLDGTPGEGVNVVWDLSKTPLPFEDETFDFIIANHVLEHVPNWFECMKELARVLKTGGEIAVWIPPVSSDSAFTYRDHINPIGLLSFTGCRTFPSGGANLFASKEMAEFGAFAKLQIIWHQTRPLVKWWLTFAPDCLLDWMTTYLRNTVSEEGFRFRKVA